jgi:hypothetical protein
LRPAQRLTAHVLGSERSNGLAGLLSSFAEARVLSSSTKPEANRRSGDSEPIFQLTEKQWLSQGNINVPVEDVVPTLVCLDGDPHRAEQEVKCESARPGAAPHVLTRFTTAQPRAGAPGASGRGFKGLFGAEIR